MAEDPKTNPMGAASLSDLREALDARVKSLQERMDLSTGLALDAPQLIAYMEKIRDGLARGLPTEDRVDEAKAKAGEGFSCPLANPVMIAVLESVTATLWIDCVDWYLQAIYERAYKQRASGGEGVDNERG